jgi:predicted nucleic acid-binding protein
MTTTLVDSNVLLDVATNDPVWFAWSARALAEAANESALAINAIIYAEISIRYNTVEELEGAVLAGEFRREPIPYEAAFLAGKAFVRYRRRGGPRISPLPDFFIGAHAAVAGFRLLTRDPRRFREYFPTVELIAPPKSS